MKTEEIYNTWKEQKSQIEVGKGFSDKVMSQIHQYEQNKRKSLFDVQSLIELMSAHTLAKAGLILTGGVVGFIRVVLMFRMVLE
ncbi:unnamed protein product [marine sediment metagenome]|uniref:Uncharacterized protein n=1 Tax=marine sediment metagenome TaxID=412755 RepID=X0W872_9ZZZZ